MKNIAIGTLVKGADDPGNAIRLLAPFGFESFAVMYWETIGQTDLQATAAAVRQAASETGTVISAVSVYGNPLRDDETGAETRRSLERLIEAAPAFGSPLVGTFAGRLPGKSVPESLESWRRLFAPLVERADALGLRIAMENCRLGDTWKTGKWNIAINGDAWELMFQAFPSPLLGLEWEPCHQVEALVDPLAQAEAWVDRIFHVHGKDARVDKALLAKNGLYGARRWHDSCLPGRGDTDWRALFALLRAKGYGGSVDIEGWNDAEWSGDREMEGRRQALAYLRICRQT